MYLLYIFFLFFNENKNWHFVWIIWRQFAWNIKSSFSGKNEKVKRYYPPLSCRGQITLSKIEEICHWAIPNLVSTISMHISNLVKNLLRFTQSSYCPETKILIQADNCVKYWQNLPNSNFKADLHNINAHTKFDENPLTFTQVIIWKQETKIRTGVQQTDERTQGQPTWYVWWQGIKKEKNIINLVSAEII